MSGYSTISHDEARAVIDAGTATVIDVRSPREYAVLGLALTGEAIPANFIPGFTTRMPAEDMAVLVNTYRRAKVAGSSGTPWNRASP